MKCGPQGRGRSWQTGISRSEWGGWGHFPRPSLATAKGRHLVAHELLEQAARQIGYDNYGQYLASPQFARLKEQYHDSGRPQFCLICNSREYRLCHRSHVRLGSELLGDVLPLCETCFDRTMRYLQEHEVPLWQMHVAIRATNNWSKKELSRRFRPFSEARKGFRWKPGSGKGAPEAEEQSRGKRDRSSRRPSARASGEEREGSLKCTAFCGAPAEQEPLSSGWLHCSTSLDTFVHYRSHSL